ncbi:hypothetical protein T440DRAFT_246501 [Plenodomus tracheiphilus IPT5]|uniref:DUF6536 domain-containing protein n=1 Tax=Plenodomus tracheiphilus IPT5 TaxID=1408161 RepID=A0A6A7AVN2_9PLEO|nr:hypothetical protein T440DRAFT_246501 [Plenodomus tracheiphilus IPT5]
MSGHIRNFFKDSVAPVSRKHRMNDAQCDGSELRKLADKRSDSDVLEDDPVKPLSIHSKTTTVFNAPKERARRLLGPRFAGWRFGVLNFACWASIVFLINFIATICGSAASQEGDGVFYDGDCDYVKKLNSGLHILINVLGTVLLGGSNYCMQAMSAPTRSEVSKAHASGTWLDIGVPGVRNLKHINRRRIVLWCLLGISSLPLHLFYNSAVYSSISSNTYWAVSVSESFFQDTECLNCQKSGGMAGYWNETIFSTALEIIWSRARNNELQRLSPSECIDEYAELIQSNRGNVLLVASDHNFPPPEQNYFINDSRVYWASSFDPSDAQSAVRSANAYQWICSGRPDRLDEVCTEHVDDIKRRVDQWRVGRYCSGEDIYHSHCEEGRWPVDYCLSEKATPHCKLHFEMSIAIVIIMLNFVKAALMFYIAFRVKEDPLMTMGDAVASFLESKDPPTRNMCLASFMSFKRKKSYSPGPRPWQNAQYRWKDVTSKTRRFITLAMFLLALVLVSVLLDWGIRSADVDSVITRVGFGAVDPRTAIMGMSSSLVANAVVANSPQLCLSLLYFSYNALFTAMLMGYEWTTYAFKSKGLRVSSCPIGAQRSTYFLQLPYRFGTPLMILSGTLHWLVSQSIFLIAIDYYDAFGKPGNNKAWGSASASGYTTLGFSPSAIISVIVLGSLMVVSIIAFGYVPYKRGMPLAGSCSLAISAACHGEENEGNAAMEKLQWGVVSMGQDGVGHCAFSTKEVRGPAEGAVYI